MDLQELAVELQLTMVCTKNTPKMHEIDEVVAVVCRALELEEYLLKSAYKGQDIADGRQIISKILHGRGYKLRQIGTLFARHHSTVIYGLNVYTDKVDIKDKKFLTKLALVAAEMEAQCV